MKAICYEIATFFFLGDLTDPLHFIKYINFLFSFKRRLDACRNWNLRIPLDEIYAEPTEYKLFLSKASDISIGKTNGILQEDNKDREDRDEESDDEVSITET